MNQTRIKLKVFSRELIPLAILVVVWLVFFGRMMTGNSVCGFRDSAYLYYPMFQWIDSIWASGQIPLWNPYDQFGVPVLADGSSSIFYPGKLIFVLTPLSFATRYGMFLGFHVLFAAMGCYVLARSFRCGAYAAALAAMGYGFGGPVVFQVTNVIYLISAAWLPLALTALFKFVRTGNWQWAVAAGVCCAIMILGGDPQMVYHIGLIGMALLVAKNARCWRRRNLFFRDREYFAWKIICGDWSRFALMVLVTVLLSLVQLLPTAEWASESDRNVFQNPRTVFEIPAYLGRADAKTGNVGLGLVGEPVEETHHAELYQFSQPPWSLYELIWPNASGRMFPVHQRWADGLAGAERVWFPSLYLGGAIALMALFSLRLWGKRRKLVLISRIGLFFCLASFGWYGFVWLVRELANSNGMLEGYGSPVGGLYWLMVVAFPKYVVFRYPAKLFVVTALMVCLLAAMTLERLRRKSVSWLMGSAVGLSVISLAICFLSNHPSIRAAIESVSTGNQFGPLDLEGTLSQIRFSAIQATIIYAVVALLVFIQQKTSRPIDNEFKSESRTKGNWVGIALLVVSAFDLVVANRWQIAEVDAKCFSESQEISKEIVLMNEPGQQLPAEVGYLNLPARDWAEFGSRSRLEELIEWERTTLAPKYHLEWNVVHRDSFSSIESGWQRWAGDLEVPRIVFQTEIVQTFDELIVRGVWQVQTEQYLEESKRFDTRVKPASPIFIVDRFRENSSSIVSEDCPAAGWLCLRESWAPGWKATMKFGNGDSQELPIARWRGRFRAVKVPEGNWRLSFEYRPVTFYFGASVSALAWFLLIAWGLWILGHRIVKKKRLELSDRKVQADCD